MGISLGSNFDVQTGLPLDSRTKVADETARDAILTGVRYEGMTVYVVADAKTYQLQGGIANANWVEYGAGSGGPSLPTGGTAEQTLIKQSTTDGDAAWETLTAAHVGLDQVDNTADADKPVSTAQATALALKADVTALATKADKAEYILNGLAEVDTAGWVTYKDAAATRPVDGTGGTATTVTFTRTTTSPIVGAGSFLFTKTAANGQGEGASYDFTIDPTDQAKNLSIKISSLVNSGTFTAGTSNTDSDVIVYLYDVTNAKLIEPTNFKILSSSTTILNSFNATFQSAANSVAYRLIFHVATATTNAFALKIDKIGVAPSVFMAGSVTRPDTITKLISGTAQTYVVPSGVTQLRVRMVGGGGGGGGSAGGGGNGGSTTFGSSFLVAPGGSGGGGPSPSYGGPGGTATLPAGVIGSVIPGNSGGAFGYPGGANSGGGAGGGSGIFGGGGNPGGAGGSGGAGVANSGGGGAGQSTSGSTYSGAGGGGGAGIDVLITSGIASSYLYSIGASGTAATGAGAGGTGYIEVTESYGVTNVELSPATDSVVVATRIYKATFATNAGTDTLVTFTSADASYDKTGGVGTNTFRVDVSGLYDISMNAQNATATANYVSVGYSINGGSVVFLNTSASTTVNFARASGSDTLNLVAGDLIRFYINTATAMTVNSVSMNIKRIPGSGGVLSLASATPAGVNYISNPDFELGLHGWSVTRNTTATVNPDNGFLTAGVTNTLTQTSSLPLRGTVSGLFTLAAVGNQLSFPFNIHDADKGKVQRFSFDYAIASGTYADDAVQAWIYDVTNAVWIQPAPFKLKNHTMASEKMFGEFQTASNSNSYRLVLHQALASTAALKIDNFNLGSEAKAYGSPVTDSVVYAPTLSNPTGVTLNTAYWRRSGEYIEITGRISWGANGAGSGATTVTLPPGLSIDTTKITAIGAQTVLGTFQFLDSGVSFKMGMVVYQGTTTVGFMLDGAGDYMIGTSLTANDGLSYQFRAPVVGWSSSVQMSDSADTRVCAAHLVLSGIGGAAATNLSVHPLIAVEDTHGGFQSSNSSYIAKSAGLYKIVFSGTFGAFTTAAAQTTTWMNKNGTEIARGTTSTISTGGSAVAYTRIVTLVSGDILTWMFNTGSGNANGINNVNIAIERLSGPSQIAASESVNGAYQWTTWNPVNNAANVGVAPATGTFSGQNITAVNSGGTVTFTFQTPGRYEVSPNMNFNASQAYTFSRLVSTFGGTATRHRTSVTMTSTGQDPNDSDHGIGVNFMVTALAGQTFTMLPQQELASSAAVTAFTANADVLIKRIGNY